MSLRAILQNYLVPVSFASQIRVWISNELLEKGNAVNVD